MRSLHVILFILLNVVNHFYSQPSEYYSILSALAHREYANSLVLNLNDTNTIPSLIGVGDLYNLQELVVFPEYKAITQRPEYKLAHDWKKDQSKDRIILNIDNYSTTIDFIPDEIGNCTKLRIISLNLSGLEHLPISLVKLTQLECLELAGCNITGAELLDVIRYLKNLKMLFIYGCNLNEEDLRALQGSLPNCNIITTIDEWLEYKSSLPVINVINVSQYNTRITMSSEREANQFLRSLPDKLIKELGMYHDTYAK